MDKIKEQVEGLAKKAAEAERSEDAMRFSQAALNAAHSAQVLHQIKQTA